MYLHLGPILGFMYSFHRLFFKNNLLIGLSHFVLPMLVKSLYSSTFPNNYFCFLLFFWCLLLSSLSLKVWVYYFTKKEMKTIKREFLPPPETIFSNLHLYTYKVESPSIKLNKCFSFYLKPHNPEGT